MPDAHREGSTPLTHQTGQGGRCGHWSRKLVAKLCFMTTRAPPSSAWCLSEGQTVPAEVRGPELDQRILIRSKLSIIERLLWAGTVSYDPRLSPPRWQFCYPHFTDEKGEAQRRAITYPRSHRLERTGLDLIQAMLSPLHPVAHCGQAPGTSRNIHVPPSH